MDYPIFLTREWLIQYPGNDRPMILSNGKERYFCPIHGSDRQRSFQLNPETGHFKCFACGRWGYLKDHISSVNRSSFCSSPSSPYTSSQLMRILKHMQVRVRPGSAPARYLAERGIPLSLARQFQVGYAPYGAWPHWKNGRPVRQWKAGRIVFPHLNPSGKIINLYGRAIGHSVPKHLRHANLPGPKGVFNAPALQKTSVYVCEGVFDALSLLSAGYSNVCALFGTYGLQWEWVQAQTLIFCFDLDEGMKAAVALAQEARKRGKEVFFLRPEVYGGYSDLNEMWVHTRRLRITSKDVRCFSGIK
jgi:DNA primase